jgi:hypothetical protein
MDVATFGMGDNPASAQILDFLPVGLRGQMVGDVQAAKFGYIIIAWHKLIPRMSGFPSCMLEELGEGARQVRGTPFQAFFLPLLLPEGVKGKGTPEFKAKSQSVLGSG